MARTNGKVRGIFERPKDSGIWWIRWACTEGHLHRQKIGARGLAAQEHGAHRKAVEKARRHGEVECPEHLRRQAEARTREDAAREHPTTYDDMAAAFLAYSQGQKRSYTSDLTIHRRLIRSFGGMVLSEITPALVERYQSHRLTTVKPATVNREVAALKAMFNRALRDGTATANPVKGLRLLKEHNERTRCLSPEEERRLFEALPEHYTPLVTLALHTGLRKGELLNVKWADVDFHTHTLTVARGKDGKTRRVPLNTVAEQTLTALRVDQSTRAILRSEGQRDSLGAYVFCDPTGRRYSHLSAFFSRAVRRAGIDNFRFHDLRHSFASRLVSQGTPLYTVSRLLGHANPMMTARYSHLSPDQEREAVERLTRRESGTTTSTDKMADVAERVSA